MIVPDIAAWCGIEFSDASANPLVYVNHLYSDENTEIKDLVIPNSVTTIGNYAFSDCSSLTSITIPNSMTTIGKDAFRDCSGLTRITLKCNEVGSWFSGLSNIAEIILGEKVSAIGSSAFSGCSGLTSITIPNSVTTIGNSAFSGCSGLSSITIPKSVTTIGRYAYYNCSSLSDIIIPSTVETIGDDAFSGCISLKNIKVLVTDYAAFCNNTIVNLIRQKIGKSVMLIDEEHTEIKEFSIPQDVTSIGNYAFYNCPDLVNITIPNSVITIGDAAFQKCSSLTNMVIPNSVNSIGSNAFSDCSSLLSVTLHCNVISTWFKGLSNINELIIGDEVTKIDNYAFSNCSTISTIEIGKGIKEIGERAFANIDKLTDVTLFAEDVPETDKTVFENSYVDYVTLHVPYGSVDKYKAVGPWKDFKEIVVIEGTQRTFGLTYKVDGEVYKIYEVKEGEAITPEQEPTKEGYTFSGWSEIPTVMPSEDLTITGTFGINKYKLTYIVDDKEYKMFEMEYNADIIPEPAPKKDGYTFSGWSEIPENMPASDVIVTGTFAVNSYKLTYNVDGEMYKTYDIEFGTTIIPEVEPTKEGYTFSGWSEIPATMPDHDVTITGTFVINKYELTYSVAGLSKMKLLVPAFEHNLNITAEEGWKVVTLTVNSEDKMGDLRDDILTINISAETEIEVTFGWADEVNLYTEDPSTGIASIEGEGVKVQAKDGQIWVDGAEGKTVRLYTIGGGLITTITPSAGMIGKFSVSPGTYIIQVGNKAAKVVVK